MKIQAIYVAIRIEGRNILYDVVADRGMTHVVMGKVISRDVAVTLARALAARYGVPYVSEPSVG